jgi:hypothetical protein
VSEAALSAIADQIIADARSYYGAGLDERMRQAFHRDLMMLLSRVHTDASRAWLGSALTRGRGDD